MSKVILLDGGALTHRAIFSWNSTKQKSLLDENVLVLPSAYTYFLMIISNLKKIGVDKDDIIIIAQEAHSWRKDFLAEYKAQREDYRESHDLINWKFHYKKINEINKQLDEATNWHFIRVENCEADDILAVGCRFFADKECIVVTADKDLYQLDFYEHVKIWTLNKKCKGSRGVYEQVKNPLKIINDKAKKGDVSDNILTRPTDTDEDFELRHFIVNLLELPDYIEEAIIEKLKQLPQKQIDFSKLPYPDSLAKRFPEIYKKKNILTYEYCVKLQEKREEARKKKQRERYQQKKKSMKKEK
jgi:5'-3' exonuclease